MVGEQRRGALLGLVGRESSGPEDQRELTGFVVAQRPQRYRVELVGGGVQQLPLGAHRDVFPGGHRQRTSEQAGQAGQEDDLRGATGPRHAQDQ